MPFREDTLPTARETPPAPERLPAARQRAILAALLVVVFAGSAAAASAWLDGRAAPVAVVSPPALRDAAGCVSTGAPALHPPGTPGAAHPQGSRSVEEFACGELRLSVTVQVFSTRANPAAIGQARRELAREDLSEEMEFGSLAVPGGEPSSWRLAIGSNPPVMAATALWIEGRPSRGGLGERIMQARNSVQGAASAPVLVAASLHFPRGPMGGAERDRAQRLLAAFLAAQAGLGGQITALARAAAGN